MGISGAQFIVYTIWTLGPNNWAIRLADRVCLEGSTFLSSSLRLLIYLIVGWSSYPSFSIKSMPSRISLLGHVEGIYSLQSLMASIYGKFARALHSRRTYS